MRLSRKVIVRIGALGLFLLVIYCLHASPGVYHWRATLVEKREKNVNESDVVVVTSAVTFPGKGKGSRDRDFSNETTKIENVGKDRDVYNVWCIFTKVASNSPMRTKFKIFVESLLKTSKVDVGFHIISDNESKVVARNVVDYVTNVTGRSMKVQYYDVNKLARQLEDIVSVMSPHFSSKPGTYYSDALFFLSLGLHRIAPEDQDRAIMFDADTKFRRNIEDLFRDFDNFPESAVFGLAPELTPVYRHVLYLYRNRNPHTRFGEPMQNGGYPGYNSGVILFNLDRLRKSIEYDQIISRDSIKNMTEKYFFKGHLGDQDFYTLLGMERPEFIHMIDCGWNRQLCTWWRDRGYADVFANYSYCSSETKLWHGNCNTPIPDD